MFFPERIRSIEPTDRVLEIGPGGTPHPRSDVLLEKIFEDPGEAKAQRGHMPELNTDKEVVFYMGGRFPFKDKEFDYVICSHVLEHVEDVDRFLSEIMRVGKKGYVEYPTIYYDYIYNIPEHITFLMRRNGVVNWIPKEETGINNFGIVNSFFHESLDKQFFDLVDTLKYYIFEGFEWFGYIPSRRVNSLDQVCYTKDEIGRLPYRHVINTGVIPIIAEATTDTLQPTSQESSGDISLSKVDDLEFLVSNGLVDPESPVRIHFGCGNRRLEGYINVGYPSSADNGNNVTADVFADITDLNFPDESIDEIRLYRIPKDFDRVTALISLIRWHSWLKAGGKLHIEAPDLVNNRHFLERLGFSPIKTGLIKRPFKARSSDTRVIVVKDRAVPLQELLEVASNLLLQGMTLPAEEEIYRLQKRKLYSALNADQVEQQDMGLSEELRKRNEAELALTGGRAKSIGLIFSKDRAMQLDATLRSFVLHCKDVQSVDLKVIYKTSNPSHEELYKILANEHSFIDFIKEVDFKKQMLSLLPIYQYILFLVDDNIFVQDFRLADIIESLRSNSDALGFSLRLGTNTTYCYTLDKEQSLPGFEEMNGEILKYCWIQANYDFAYPLEVSSSMYRVEDILPLLIQVDFSNPNTLEAKMDENKYVFSRKEHLLCYKQSATFCNPINITQSVYPNRVGNVENYSLESLASMFGKGYRIDVESYSGFIPNACHQEVELKFQQMLSECFG